ncbi:cytochrome c family protein [Shimia thalassica]|uniref:Cytochrome c552 n=1 Tax=Shimia thalassica TaxID=1715693 RepID=A0A0P1IC32_9RHOB|nr:cytochrome c family protein [Shimia thalassica]PHO04539.1 cytochrome c family protein [Rhodobacteraceae bacterium 4F10]MBU2943491.1 cytochrome c family protein [Shimia thalassica]MDO6478705.1 cytochrome c family protein [Shimia thalassica]MDO6484571.1 cytochrome c family protein [Shimia thalassica]MDO6501561.1 cytochrome c family protein [Shimia thalassica]
MFDTMTMTKTLGALCGSLLILLLGAWAAETLYHVGGGGHGDHAAQAYVIEVEGEDGNGAEEAEEGPSLEELIASADVAKGAKAFSKCKACHKLEDGANATGPHLFGVVNRAVGSVPGFGYSGKLVAVADVWSPENLNGFIENPKKFAPGTKMSFSGMKKPTDRANLIAYLDSIGN